MLSTVSPVMVGDAEASPQPTKPLSVVTLTSTLSLWSNTIPAILSGLVIGSEMAIGVISVIFIGVSSIWL